MNLMEAARELERTGQPIGRPSFSDWQLLVVSPDNKEQLIYRGGPYTEAPDILIPDILADDWELFYQCKGCGKWVPASGIAHSVAELNDRGYAGEKVDFCISCHNKQLFNS